MAELRVGTCSWKYPSWEGLVYSAPKGIDYLKEYAERYSTVEVDQWFWSLFGDLPKMPNPADVRAYRAAVPDDFRFTVKIPNSVTLTHYHRRKKTDPLVPNPHFLSLSLMHEFLESLGPLDDVLGPLMFQFEYLNREKMASQKEFEDALGRFVEKLPRSYEYGVEIRNPNYLNESYFGFVHRNGLTPVLLQGYYMPQILGVVRQYGGYLVKAPTVVIRLHGVDRGAIEKLTGKRWNRIVEPRDGELHVTAGIVHELLECGVNVYVNVNNHYEGSAPLTMSRFERLLLDF